jgi:ribosomal protein S18 acetylase RimI-like enzyme
MVTVRAARDDDLAAVLALWADAGAAPSATDDIDALHGLLARDPEALLLAEVAGGVAGTLIAGWDGWRGNMYRLAVAPAQRRRGIATALVRAAHDRLRAAGCRRITALVLGSHDHAVGFWERAGYDWQVEIRRYTR